MKKSFYTGLAALCAMIASLPVLAANLPDYYPEQFDRWGVIDQLDLGNLVIVVNDQNIHVARNLQVHTLNTRFATGQSLQPGMKIGFGTSGSRALSGAVSEVWVLPADYTAPGGGNTSVHERRSGRD